MFAIIGAILLGVVLIGFVVSLLIISIKSDREFWREYEKEKGIR